MRRRSQAKLDVASRAAPGHSSTPSTTNEGWSSLISTICAGMAPADVAFYEDAARDVDAALFAEAKIDTENGDV